MKKNRPPKLVYIKQFCNNCKNQRAFKIKKNLWVNSYCFQCIVCKQKIKYPHRFDKIQEYFFKLKKGKNERNNNRN